MTEHNNPAGPAANKDTLRAELANALHDDWCGCDSWDGVNCEDYHDSEFPGSADAVLAVVVPALERLAAELAEVRASREAWVLEADRLDVIATAAEYHTGPEECCDSECDHLHDDEGNFTGSDDDWCPHVEMRHAMAEDAIEAHKVPLLVSAIERLTREQDEAQAKLEQSHEINEGWVRYGERVKQQKREWRQRVSEHRNLLGAIWLHVGWRSVTRHLTTEQRELWADAVEVAGAPGSTIAADRWWRDDAPVSGSDTTEDGGDRD